MGLLNTRNIAKAEDDLPRRDTLLDGLRFLQQNDPENTMVRETWTRGLNVLIDETAATDLSHHEILVKERHCLQQNNPGDVAVL